MSVSLWTDTHPIPSSSRLNQNLEVDVCIIGGGLGGVLTAYLLQRSGKKVCLLESREIGSGQSGLTTAQFSPVLDHRYYELESMHGKEGARLIAQSQNAALDAIENIVRTEKIECDLRRVDGYLFSHAKNAREELQRELEAVHRASLTDVYFLEAVPDASFEALALCFPRQIELHPMKLLAGLVQCFVRDGGQLFTHTHVKEVSETTRPVVTTETDYKVECQAVVVATNSPIHDRFAMHTKQSPYRTYVLALEIPKGSVPTAMYWDTEDPYHYVRTQAHPTDESLDLLIVGGEDHKTGQEKNAEKSYERLEDWAREHFPMAKEIPYHWSGQVMESADGLAFLGHHSSDHASVYVITGDTGNGMTNCTIGAILIRDQIFDRTSRWTELYRPDRRVFSAWTTFLKENMNVMAQYSDWFEPGEVQRLEEIEAGEGAIFRHGTHLIAVYRETNGEYRMYSAACPHLKGAVRWNSAEKSWDCPCHGSRFDAHGRVMEGPACSNLEEFLVEKARSNSFALR